MNRGRWWLGLGALVVATGLAAEAAAQCPQVRRYRVVELATMGGPLAQGLAINDHGVVAGIASDQSWVMRPARWSGGIAALDAATGAAYGIGSDGQIAGYSQTASGFRATVWSPAAGTRWLAPLDGQRSSVAWDVNALGTAIGYSVNAVGDMTPVSWPGGSGAAQALLAGLSPAASNGIALAVNDDDQVVGYANFAVAPYRRAWFWSPASGAAVLAGLGGGLDQAADISPAGLVAGSSVHGTTGRAHAVLWSAGAPRDLGAYQDRFSSAGYGVNDCGVVVGDAMLNPYDNVTTALVWQGAGAQALNDLIAPGSGWDLQTARAINARGEIVGHGFKANGWGRRAFVLIPDDTAPAPLALR